MMHKANLLTAHELLQKVNGLEQFYMPINLNREYHQCKINAFKELTFIVKHSDRKTLQDTNIKEILFCGLTLVYYFGMHLKENKKRLVCLFWSSKRRFQKVERVFLKIMDVLVPERCDATVKITLNFFTVSCLWSYESLVIQILDVILHYSRGKATLFHLLLTEIHYVLYKDLNAARHRLRVLYQLLNSANWNFDQHKLLPYVTRLLDLFAKSIERKDNKLNYIRQGFVICLRRIFERVTNEHRFLIITTMLNWFSMVEMDHHKVLEFSTLLYHAADFYEVTTYRKCLGEGLMNHIMINLICSTNATHSLVGCRLLCKFLDRQNNSCYLLFPQLFYEYSQVPLTLGENNVEDKVFIRRYRQTIHNALLTAIKYHNNNIVNIQIVYSVICIILLEVPCGLTAAAVACMLMSIQDLALNADEISTYSRYWMHTIVVSVMSLACWVHKAPVLYSYVNVIIARRAKEAPQLNPPLLLTYKIGQHHVTWNKPTFFFEDWELRYALWKHFQEAKMNGIKRVSHTRLSKNKPTLDLLG